MFVFLKTICPFARCNVLLMFFNAFPFDTWVEKRHSISICSRPFRKPSPAAFPLSCARSLSLPHSIDSVFHLIKQSSVSIPPLASRNVKLESSRPFFISLICPLSLMEPERSASRRANRLRSAGGIKGNLPYANSLVWRYSQRHFQEQCVCFDHNKHVNLWVL